MYTKVIRNQFEIKEGAIIHTPTRGRVHSGYRHSGFDPHLDRRDWTPFTDRRAISLCRCVRSNEDDLATRFAGGGLAVTHQARGKRLPC